SYEKLPEHVVPVVIEEPEKKDEQSLKSKITGLFKKSTAHSDYPISDQYDGPLDSTHRAENLQGVPLSHEVASYPSEFSYEKLPEHVVPVVIEEPEKKDEQSLKSKITGLFKKSTAHSDYPISDQYDGPLDSTHRAENLQDVPLSHEVASYPSEFSYEKLPEHVVPVVIEEPEKKDEQSLKSKITGLFKKSTAHSDYPISDQYDGPLDSTHRAENLQDVPLSHEVASYPSEFSYEKLPEHVVPVVIKEPEKKDEQSLKSKITGLFKKSTAHSDYPISDQYDGPLDSTHRAENLQDVPLSHEVVSYPSEFSYEKLPEHVVPVVIEEPEKEENPALPNTDIFSSSHDTISHEKYVAVPRADVVGESASGVSLLKFKDSGLFGPSDQSHVYKAEPAVSTIQGSRPSRNIYTRTETDMFDPQHSTSAVFSHTEINYQNTDNDDLTQVDIQTKDRLQHSSFVDDNSQYADEPHKRTGYMWSKYETERSRLSRRDAAPQQDSVPILDPVSLSKHHLYSYSQTETSQRTPISKSSPPGASIDKQPEFDVSFKVIPQEPKEDIGFSVSISARSPLPPLTIDESPQLLSVENLIHSHTSPNQRRLSPHTWTTVRETTEVSYIKRVTVTSSTDYGRDQTTLRRNRSPIQSVARQVHSFPSTSQQAASTTCRWTTFDDPALQVHHPIYPPSQSLYKSTPKTERASYLTVCHSKNSRFIFKQFNFQNGESSNQRNGGSNCHNGNGTTRSYGEVREIHAHDRTEILRDDEVRRLRREDVFTVGTPFVMGRVEADERGNEYLRYERYEDLFRYNRHDELPMIEDGAMECRRSTVRARLREMDEVRLVGEREEIERQRRPIRRARQRVRNICTML
ncbi:hypothetical protein CRE_24047, partial [Caenorhabditis remanei]